MHSERRRIQFEHRRIVSFDGTVLACQTAGKKGPSLMLTNGLGGSYLAWRPLLEGLPGWHVLSWDYRGLYRSGPPAQEDALDIASHAKDLDAVRRVDGAEKLVLIGWSMGVQVNFEYYRQHREHVAAIVCINGVAGLPFHTAFGTSLLRHGIPTLLTLLRRRAKLTQTVVRKAATWKGLVPTLQRMGLCSPTLDVAVFNELAHDFADLDFAQYARMFEYLGAHDANDLLPRIDVPVLIIAGDRDQLTPKATAHAMHKKLPNSRLHVVAGGTHYTPVETPGLVASKIRAFLREAGLAPDKAAQTLC